MAVASRARVGSRDGIEPQLVVNLTVQAAGLSEPRV